MKRLVFDNAGNFSLMVALAVVPVFGAAGMAVDFARATAAKSFYQDLADRTALSVARGGTDGDPANYLHYARTSARKAYGYAPSTGDVDVRGIWTTTRDYRVTVTGKIRTTILSAIPGFPNEVLVSARATAEVGDPIYEYQQPRVSEVDPGAADYNRLYVYCYDPEQAGDRGTHGRTQMTAIADNAGTKYRYTMPNCAVGEYLSYRLYNVRDARTTPGAWDSSESTTYDFYTDTVVTGDRETYHLGYPMLETALCDTYELCTPQSQGGVIPEGVNRTPHSTDSACAPGKFMYYGWEDRPPGAGWSDRDYNDIRVIIQCPTVKFVGNKSVRLVD